MIRFRLKALLAEKEFQEGRRVTLEEVAAATGIHRTTLSKLANQRGYNTTTDILDKLCTFFRVELSELVAHVPDPKRDENSEDV
jgi:putative transcriptional regulator